MAPSLPAHMAIPHSNVHTALSDGASSGLMVLAISFPVFLLAILAAVVIIVCRPSSRTASPADEDMSVHHPSTVSFGEDPFSRLPLERRVSTASSMTKRATSMAPLPVCALNVAGIPEFGLPPALQFHRSRLIPTIVDARIKPLLSPARLSLMALANLGASSAEARTAACTSAPPK
jgi:hypothetical protein